MSWFWSSWIAILSLACWLCIAALLYLVIKKWQPTLAEDGTTGHEYDGIKEFDKPLPKWWLWIFYLTMVWGIGYFLLYPSIMPGKLTPMATVEVDGKQVPWSSANELMSDLQKNNKVFLTHFNKKVLQNPQAETQLKALATLQTQKLKASEGQADIQKQIDQKITSLAPEVVTLASNPRAIKVGQKLFLQNCAVCHGSNAKGAVGYPNLTDNDWLYGGKPEDILHTLHKGRIGGMAAWRDTFGEEGVEATTEYVLSLAGRSKLDATLVERGGALYKANCAVCHGQDGKGSTAVGAPNLTDKIWLYGGDRKAIAETIRHGRAGVMPAWDSILGNERIMLLSAYVYSLSNNTNVATAQAQPERVAAAKTTGETKK